jgi:hypothetical protein
LFFCSAAIHLLAILPRHSLPITLIPGRKLLRSAIPYNSIVLGLEFNFAIAAIKCFGSGAWPNVFWGAALDARRISNLSNGVLAGGCHGYLAWLFVLVS